MPLTTVQKLRVRVDPSTWALVVFVARLTLYLGVAVALLPRMPQGTLFRLQAATAEVAASLLRLFSEDVTRRADVVTFAGFSVRIVSECFGLLEMVIFSAAVLAFSTTWRKRWLGLALGLPAIFAFNLLRILMLLCVGRYSPAFFEFAHIYFWQATLILVITALWLLWVRYVVRDETRAVVRP